MITFYRKILLFRILLQYNTFLHLFITSINADYNLKIIHNTPQISTV